MAISIRPLTTIEVDKAKPKIKPYRLYDGGGLVLNIAVSGTKTWYFQYTRPFENKKDMLNLGRYPNVTLNDARKKRNYYQELLLKNINPKQQIEDEKLINKNKFKNDFKSVFDEWLLSKDYTQATLDKMKAYINITIAVIGNKPVSDITTQDCMGLLKPIERAGHYTKLQKIRTMLNQCFSYAIATGRAKENPVLHLRGVFKRGDVRHNPAILDEYRLSDLVNAIYGYHGHFVTRQCLLFTLLVFCRSGEVRNMRWEDVDLDKGIWRYTPNKTVKSTNVHLVVPLSSQALQILHEMRAYKKSKLVFPSTISSVRPLSENTLNQALRRMGFDNTEQTTHGFRAIARTLLEERFKYDYRMIEMQLGHQVRDSNGRAYNRVQWLDERREMLQTWSNYLFGLFK